MDTSASESAYRPTFAELLDFAEGRLTESEHQRMERSLSRSPEAVIKELDWIQAFVSKARKSTFHPLADPLKDSLIALYKAPEASLVSKGREWAGTLCRLFAEWVEPEADPAFGGLALRSRSMDRTPLQWTFRTAEVDICLNALKRPGEGYDLHGQVFAAPDAVGAAFTGAQLLQGNRCVQLTEVDAYGEFVVSKVPAGAYALVVTDGKTEVMCTPLKLEDGVQ